MDQVVPSRPQQMYWDVTQGQGHHPQVGPQTSIGYISDLIYTAAIVTNFLEFKFPAPAYLLYSLVVPALVVRSVN